MATPQSLAGSVPQSLAGVAVTLVAFHYAPEVTGNAPYNCALAESLAAAGASVRVITGVPHYPMWRIQPPYDQGLRHEECNGLITISRRRHWVPRRASVLGRMLMEATFLVHALPSVWRSRSDVIIAVSPMGSVGAAVAGRRGQPLGIVVQDLIAGAAEQSGLTGSKLSRLIAGVERFLLKRADRVAVITPGFTQLLASIGVPAERVALLPNFTHITAADSTREEARARLGWPLDRFSVVHTGNMGMKQGLENVVEAARLAEQQGLDIEFVLVGDGNQRRFLESLAVGLTALRFVDPLTEDEYPYALAAADVLLVNESPGAKEFCLPSKLTSYVVAGRPIIVSSDPESLAYQTVSKAGSAYVVAAGRPDLLLRAVRDLMQDETLRRRLSDAALRTAPDFTRGEAYRRYVDFAAELALSGDVRR